MNIGALHNSPSTSFDDYKGLKGSRHNGRASESNKAAEAASENNISKKNENKLSQKAQDYLNSLRKKYGKIDFLIGNSTDDLQEVSKGSSKEYSVILSSAEIERMADDEKYANEKIDGIAGAVSMAMKICEQEGYVSAFDAVKAGNGTVNKISIAVDDNGNMKFWAELEKTNDKQKERLEKAQEKRLHEKKNPYEKKNDSVKRTTVEASSMDELVEKIRNIDWDSIVESKSGDAINYIV